MYFFFPETRGHSLEEIATVFDGPNAANSPTLLQSKADKADKEGYEEHIEERIDVV